MIIDEAWLTLACSWACILLQLSAAELLVASSRAASRRHAFWACSFHPLMPLEKPRAMKRKSSHMSHVHEQSMFHHSAHVGIPSMDALEFLLLVGAIRLQCHRVIRLISHDSILKKKTLQQHVRLNYLKICRMSIGRPTELSQLSPETASQTCNPGLTCWLVQHPRNMAAFGGNWSLVETGAWIGLRPNAKPLKHVKCELHRTAANATNVTNIPTVLKHRNGSIMRVLEAQHTDSNGRRDLIFKFTAVLSLEPALVSVFGCTFQVGHLHPLSSSKHGLSMRH